jgi:hypothetical protein
MDYFQKHGDARFEWVNEDCTDFKDKYKSDKSSLEQYVWVKDGSVDVFGKESNLKLTAALKKID